ncbi:hypothetical protein KK090_02520 [Curtobacterium flaccumfaciens pv. poinsettiae]|uniref:hypothetical protein n=1 Tax=Curtobacterium poinsettiae TaxID=159612 RepID=UPI001BE0F388|nr:hypothetical protein [Curtobacterium flaccumfaciens]MBT1618122.1 hypothetical protein [Curtobacterium flaccumfaciens pv. poinsettiae]
MSDAVNGDEPDSQTTVRATVSEVRTDFLVWMPLRTGVVLIASSTITAISVAAVAALVSVFGATAAQSWIAVARFGLGVAADANWLLPTLFAAILAVLAILAGQNFVGLHEQDVAANRRRLVAASWIIAGVATATLLLSFLSLAAPETTPRHLWASTLITALIVSAAFWGGDIVLRSPQQQLIVLATTEEDLQRRIDATPDPHEHRRPWLRLTVSLTAFALTATIAASAFALLAGVLLPAQEGEILADLPILICICGGAAVGGSLQASLISQMRDNTITRWGALLSAGPSTLIALSPLGIIGASLPTSPTTRASVIAILGAYTLPLLSAFAPRTLWRGWTPRGALDGLRFRRFRRRHQRLQQERQRIELASRAKRQHEGWRVRRGT